jgi:predicted DNA-binding transcriptional regulator AlpA
MKFINNNYSEKEMTKILTIQKLMDKIINIEEAMLILQKSERQIFRYISNYKLE